MREPSPVDSAVERALRLLRHRPRSRRELELRLLRSFPSEVVSRALERLERAGLVDDRAFARFWSENRQRHRPRSPRMIVAELTARGVPRQVALEAVEGADEDRLALEAGRRYIAHLRGLDLPTFARRLQAYLARRGFSRDAIASAVRALWHEAGGKDAPPAPEDL